MRRGVLRWTGVVALLLALVLLAGAAWSLLLVGSDEAVASPTVRLRSDGVALVADDLRADVDLVAPDRLGRLELVVSGAGEMFVGEAPPVALDEYLAGAPYDAVVSLGPVPRTAVVPGDQQPPPPGSTDIWVRQAIGDPARLRLPATPGTSLVVMRADARPGVEADLLVRLRLPGSWVAGWVLLSVGVVLLGLGIVALVRSRRRPVPARHSAEQPLAADVLPGSAPAVGVGALPTADPPGPESLAPGRTARSDEPVPATDPDEPELRESDPADADAGLVPPAPDPTRVAPPPAEESG